MSETAARGWIDAVSNDPDFGPCQNVPIDALADALADIEKLSAGLSTAGGRARAIVEEVSRG